MLEKRLEQIYKIIEEKQEVKVDELAEMFGVTTKTIRLDLDVLEDSGLVNRFHGGAVLAKSDNRIYNMLIKKAQNIEEKRQIAKKAYEFINEGDTIYLDSGTTTFELAKLIDKHVTVVTNDPYIAWELNKNEYVMLYVVGGRLKRVGQHTSTIHTEIYCGSEAIKMIKSFTIQKMFVGCSALNLEQGLMVFSIEDAEIKKAALSASKKIIGLADYSKIGKSALFSFASVDSLEFLITDRNISDEKVEEAKDNNLDIIIA